MNNLNDFELEQKCKGDCYNCPYEEQCDNSKVQQDNLLNSLDEW